MTTAYGTCPMCEQRCYGTPSKIKLWAKLHFKKAHSIKFEGADFVTADQIKSRHHKDATKKDDVIEFKQVGNKIEDFLKAKRLADNV